LERKSDEFWTSCSEITFRDLTSLPNDWDETRSRLIALMFFVVSSQRVVEAGSAKRKESLSV